MPSHHPGTRRVVTLLALSLCALFSTAIGVAAATPPGGIASVEPTPPPVPGEEAILVAGRAVPPESAPAPVQRAIEAANRIRTKPYVWGGGHGRWWDRGYDCSGSVSYMLHGAGLLRGPLVSGSLARWGRPGPGRWITIYANGGHTFAVVAGLRWDTAGNASGSGPRWHSGTFSTRGYAVRHPVAY